MLYYPEMIDHDFLFVDGRDSTRKVVENETTRFDLQTGKSLVEDGCESIVQSIMSDACTGCADDIVQRVMDFVIKIGIQGLRFRNIWRPVPLVFFQAVMSVLPAKKAKEVGE